MGWRSLIISQPARLAVQDRQLLLEQERGSVTLPLEDLAVVVLETPQAVITSALLSQLAAYGVALLTCDETHHPNGVLLPYLPHSRATKVLQQQLSWTQPQKKRAWASIVQQKIRNQARVLHSYHAGPAAWLAEQARRVASGDPDNREGLTAKHYFSHLFGPDFNRAHAHWRNAALDYGYAVIRAAIARALVAHGFLPALGLHHKSQLNAFNLADDLIEPLRPLVDRWVVQHAEADEILLQPAHKAALVQCLYADVQMNRGVMNALAAIEAMVISLGKYCESHSVATLDWPALF